MRVKTSMNFDFGDLNKFYFDLLSEEDFDFKTKNINIGVFNNNDNNLEVEISCGSVLELKIATSALIKSLEVIGKTLEV